jgi:hypothetical protein
MNICLDAIIKIDLSFNCQLLIHTAVIGSRLFMVRLAFTRRWQAATEPTAVRHANCPGCKSEAAAWPIPLHNRRRPWDAA